ncbi:MAG: hydroxymethylbilane synthase, partial [Candidatus Geothermarchaeales archaeon]
KGIFEKEIDLALIRGKIDFAVHSLKDVPSDIIGIEIAAVLERGSPHDVLVTRDGNSLEELPPGSIIGTSSPRRKWQVEKVREDLRVEPIRGNVDTRVRKVMEGRYDGAVLAEAGLVRLGMHRVISQRLSLEDFTPAPGQGALVAVCREGDQETRTLLSEVDHEDSRMDVMAERAFLQEVMAGCRVPLGAYGRVDGEDFSIRVSLSTANGEVWTNEVSGPKSKASELGRHLGRRVVDRFGSLD